MSISIEDFYEDIIDKAQGGLGVTDVTLVQRSGITAEALDAAKSGHFDEEVARAIAPELQLDPAALVEAGRRAWYPEPMELTGLAMFNTPFPVPGYEEMTVNAYLVWDSKEERAAVFDTGANSSGILEKLELKRLTVESIFLTHTHGDHIADLSRLQTATGGPPTYANRLEPVKGAIPIDEGATFSVGNLKIEARLTNGHSPGGTTYVIEGLDHVVAVVGDSVFANSMGGSPCGYLQAVENNRTKILSLPSDTVICPGHGPITTVAQERAHNPFHPELK